MTGGMADVYDDLRWEKQKRQVQDDEYLYQKLSSSTVEPNWFLIYKPDKSLYTSKKFKSRSSALEHLQKNCMDGVSVDHLVEKCGWEIREVGLDISKARDLFLHGWSWSQGKRTLPDADFWYLIDPDGHLVIDPSTKKSRKFATYPETETHLRTGGSTPPP